jgi:N6-L-threonylcarbamoyladenine synthase
MIVLGIETSCDETAVAIVRGRRVLASEVASSAASQAEFGGVVPEIASRSHLEALLPCLDQALHKAKSRLSKIDLIAVTQGPGLAGSLVVGVSAAKALALALGKPVIPVDHVLAHAYSGQLLRKHPGFPFVALVVSGGHTLIAHWKSEADVRILGRTVDDAAGEAFDKVAKMMGLGYPGGPAIEREARAGDPKKFTFPRAWLREPHYDFSFSGLKTAVLYKLDELTAREPLTAALKRDVAAGFQEAVCDVLVRKTMRALEETGAKTLVVGGGVAANGRLKRMFEAAAAGKCLEIVFPTKELAADNAVMIASLGEMLYRRAGSPSKTRTAFDAYADFFVQKNRLVRYNSNH